MSLNPRMLLFCLLFGCGDDRLPGFATGDAPPGAIDASTPLDSTIPDAGPDASADAT